jgi:hypothetical protein
MADMGKEIVFIYYLKENFCDKRNDQGYHAKLHNESKCMSNKLNVILYSNLISEIEFFLITIDKINIELNRTFFNSLFGGNLYI